MKAKLQKDDMSLHDIVVSYNGNEIESVEVEDLVRYMTAS